MVLDYFVSFCDDGNCKPNSPYRCEYPQVKIAHANLLNDEPIDWNKNEYCNVILFQLEAFDKFRKGEKQWTVKFILNDKYCFEYEEDYWQASDYLNHEFAVADEKIPISEFEHGIDVQCELLCDGFVMCTMLVDIVITTVEG